MKKLLIVMLMTILGIDNVCCQEVRGVETRRVVYRGENYAVYNGRWNEYYDEYYGWELKNRNSIPVSVEITLNRSKDDGVEIVTTKDVVLDSGETYIFKPKGDDFEVHSRWKNPIDLYYITYKAYKLE